MIGFDLLAGAALKGTVALAAAAAAAGMLRRRSAAARHLVWTGAAAALLALPVLTVTLPELRVPAPQDRAAAFFQVFAGRTASPSGSAGQVAPAAGGAALGAAPVWDWRPWAVAIWSAGASAGVFQMLLAWGAVARLRRRARPIEVEMAGPVEVLESDGEGMPMTFGVFRPVVLLPAGASEWAPERLRVVLLHELAHVRRGDVATHLLARTALALYWWNPLAWFAWRQFLKERERATDDLVLQAGARASEYAMHLLEVARTFQPAPATGWAALSMARRSQLEGRLIAILDGGVDRRAWGRRAQVAAAGLAIAAVAPFAAIQAQDISVPPEAEATVRAAMAQKNHEILDRAAAAYEKAAKLDVARRLLENSLAIRERAGDRAYAAGLVKLGDLAARRGQTDQATAFYTKAVALGDGPEVAGALVYLGERAFGASDRASAENLLQRVLRVETRGRSAGRALLLLALMRQTQPGGDGEAEVFYQKAVAAEAENAEALRNYARLLRGQRRTVEAEQMEARALEAAVNSRQVYRVGGGVTAPALLFKKEPEYSEEARAAKFQGTVLLYVEITPEGNVENMAVARRLGLGLDEKAIEAVRQWKFKPGTKDGVPVATRATIEVNFRLM